MACSHLSGCCFVRKRVRNLALAPTKAHLGKPRAAKPRVTESVEIAGLPKGGRSPANLPSFLRKENWK